MISFWYKREESQRRFTVFWSSVLFASMFGGLLASAIANMHGVRGYSSWRWIFILEGIATIVIGIGAYFLVADFPADARWLSAEEKEFVIARTETDERAASPITARKVVSFFGDVKNVIGGFMYFGKCGIYSHTSILANNHPQPSSFQYTVGSTALRLRRRTDTATSLLLLCSDDSQDPRLLDRGDPVAYGPTSRGCAGSLPDSGLPIRPPPPPVPIHLPGLLAHHGRPRDPTDNPSGFPRAIPRHLSGRNGLLLRRSHHRLLVCHEPDRAHG